MLELVIILLPIAAASGWYVASRHYQTNPPPTQALPVNRAYIRGLNYLLNEKPEQAIDAFASIRIEDQETTEFHIALGSFFRRRGEVEKAIKIHQDLLNKQSLQSPERGQVLIELGRDYACAGLYDRAEDMLTRLTQNDAHQERAMQLLLHIYQQERDWLKAIEYTHLLQAKGKLIRGEKAAQFYCELALEAKQAGQQEQAEHYLQTAYQEEPGNIRVALLRTELCIQRGDMDSALTLLKQIAEQAPAFIPALLPSLQQCYEQTADIKPQIEYLHSLNRRHHPQTLPILLSNLLARHQNPQIAVQFISETSRQTPDIHTLNQLVQLQLSCSNDESPIILKDISRITAQLASATMIRYRCTQCGFNGTELHWRCPGCHHWETIFPTT